MEKQVPHGFARVVLTLHAYKHFYELYSSKETLEEAYAAIDHFAACIGEDLKRDIANEYDVQDYFRDHKFY